MSDNALKTFVPLMEAAAAQGNPNMNDYWRIILKIQERLARPGDGTVVPLTAIKRDNGPHWEDKYDQFAKHAYEYLEFGYRMRASEQFIKRIAWTKPNIRRDAFKDMNAHELCLARKIHKGDDEEDQTYDGRMKSTGEFWVHQEVINSHTAQSRPIESLRDIPIYSRDESLTVKELMEALTNMEGELDGNERQINAVKKASKGVIQHLAFMLMVSNTLYLSVWLPANDPIARSQACSVWQAQHCAFLH